MELIIKAGRIFVMGVGREGIAARAFAMRLMHLGKEVHWIWDDTTPGMHEGDLFIAVNGSGEIGHIAYTVKEAAKTGAFTVSFADINTVAESDYLGIVSANQVPDKVAKVGFTVTPSPNVDAPIINENPLTLECKVVSWEDGTLIGEVVNMSADEKILTDGKVDLDKLQPIVFDAASMTYRATGKIVGKAWGDGKKFQD